MPAANTTPAFVCFPSRLPRSFPLLLLLSILASCPSVESVFLQGSQTSHLRFPKWNCCSNSSLSFDFRTNKPEGLLLYVDDGGRNDFLEISYTAGYVEAVLKISSKRSMKSFVIVDDGRWHNVEVRRNGPQTSLIVDGITDSSYIFGVDLNFGLGPENNSFVFIGGLPSHFGLSGNLKLLSLPSALYRKRYNGYIRNVLFGNCTCMREKVHYLGGEGFDDQSAERCAHYSCPKGCLCLSRDSDIRCDCTDKHCIEGIENHFELALDSLEGKVLIDSADVNASIDGHAVFDRGVHGEALLVGSEGGRVVVSGAECLGEQDSCHMGFTLSLWVKFFDSCAEDTIVLSNKDLDLRSQGLSAHYHKGTLTVRFKKGNLSWVVSQDNVLSSLWYHVAVTWHTNNGLVLYVNGEQSDEDVQPAAVSPGRNIPNVTMTVSQLILGCPFNDDMQCGHCQMLVDDFNFRSKRLFDRDIKESGPLFCYRTMTMDTTTERFQKLGWNMTVTSFGVTSGSGKIGNGAYFANADDYMDAGDQYHSCLGNLVLCKDGVTVSMWIKLMEKTVNEFFFLSSGSKGIEIFYKDGLLTAVAQQGPRHWRVSWDGMNDNEWCFLEVTWKPSSGLRMFVSLKQVGHSEVPSLKEPITTSARLYIGRSNLDSVGRGTVTEHIQVAAIDQVQVCYGSRESLEMLDLIQRGRPTKYSINMDVIVNNMLVVKQSSLVATVVKNPLNVPGKVNNATRLDGNDQYIDLGNHGNSCLGNLQRCRHGFTGSMWMKFLVFSNDTYYLSTGGGVKIYSDLGRLHVCFSVPGKMWNVSVPEPPTDAWHFVEFSWHSDFGLRIYINNKLLVERDKPFPTKGVMVYDRGSLRIGYGNEGDSGGASFRSGNFLVDETEFWFSDRDTLLAFGYIAREDIRQISISFDQQEGDLGFSRHDGAALVPGQFGNAIGLRGNTGYATLEIPSDNCATDLERCTTGLTIIFFVQFQSLVDNSIILSSASYDIFLHEGKITAEFFVVNKAWTVESGIVETGRWYRVDISWDEEKGLQLYLDKLRVDQTTETTDHSRTASSRLVYVGRSGSEDMVEEFEVPDALVDQIKFWFANRDQVKAFGFLEDDVNGLILDMERIEKDILFHQTHVVFVHGSPKTVRTNRGNGVQLNGLNQYLDIGKDVACKGNLANCPKGFTLRFLIKPLQLLDNTYFVSSAPVDIFYRNNRLVADVRTPVSEWSVSSPALKLKTWTQVDVSWDSGDGLVLYINGTLAESDKDPITNEWDYDESRRFLIGKANTNMRSENYANAIFDDVEFWEANRKHLLQQGHIGTSKERMTSSPKRPNKALRSKARPIITQPPPPETINQVRHQTNSFYGFLPTGKPLRTSTARFGLPNYDFFPTLPPSARKRLVFDGQSYIAYDVSQFPEDYMQENGLEHVRLKFKTGDPNGLLWYSGSEDKHIHLSVKSGYLLLVANYDGKYFVEKFRVTPVKRLDDNEWHDIYVTRSKRHVTITVDGSEFLKMLAGDIGLVNLDSIYVAGSDNTRALTNSHMRNNFRGTLDKVIISGDSLPSDINLIDVAFVKPTPPFIDIYGNVNSIPGGTDTSAASEPGTITFTKEHSFLRLPLWDAELRGSLEFFFKTVEPHGLIVYNGGQPSHRDFFAIELYDGILYVVIDLGSGVYKYLFTMSGKVVNDGAPHFLKVERIERTMKLNLDHEERSQDIVSGQSTLNLGTFLFLGAVDNSNRLPWHLWTRNPKYFVGCIWGMRINDEDFLDLPGFAVEQKMMGKGIEPGCRTKPLECVHAPCVNGICANRWNGALCQCEDTPYTGTLCHEPAVMVAFTGTELASITMRPMLSTHTNDFSVRFKTPRETGLLFKTITHASNDYLKAFLDNGNVMLETNLGGQLQSFRMIVGCEKVLSHDQWHTLHVRRRANYLSGWVDNCQIATAESPGEGYTLDIDQLLIGRESSSDNPEKAFIGHMQNFMFGLSNVFELIGPKQPPGMTIENSGEITTVEIPIPLDPVTLRLFSDAFVVMECPPTHKVTLSIMFRTSEPDGVLLFRTGLERDFFGLELVKGRVRVVSDEGTGVVEAITTVPLNDNDWHVINIEQPLPKTINVSIDNLHSAVIRFQNSSQNLDLTGLLSVGGIAEPMTDNISTSFAAERIGFSGCLASLYVEGRLFNLLTDSLRTSGLVIPGCTDVKGFCGASVCKHFGACKETIDGFTCDCNLTSFVGKTCEDEAEGYRFGYSDSRGLATSMLGPRPETDEDVLVFGFMSWYPNGTMIRIESPINAHFIEAKLEGGLVAVEFDIGRGVQRLVQESPMLNDSKYHSVLFRHNGLEGFLRVDNFPRTENTASTENAEKLLNEFSTVRIGGALNNDDAVINHFDGIIAGVYFNGIRVIDAGIYEIEKQMSTRGDIILASHPFFLPKPSDSTFKPTDMAPPSGKPTSKSDVGTPEPEKENDLEQKPKIVPAEIGGGGIGWKFVEKSEGLVIILLPSNEGGGGINTGKFDGTSMDHHPVVGASSSVSRVPAGNDSSDGIRAGAVGGTMLCLLAAASSLIWALYKFKPGLVGRSSDAFQAQRPVSSYYISGDSSLMPMFTSTVTGQRVPVARLPSVTFPVSAGRADSVVQTYVSAVGGVDLGSAFVSLTSTSTSSRIAGLVTQNDGFVSRGTQSDMTSLAVSQFGGTWSVKMAESNGNTPSRQGTVELTTAQTQTHSNPESSVSIDDTNMIAMNGGLGYGSGYDESLSSTSISYPSAIETGSTGHPSVVDRQFRTLSPPLTFGTLQTENSYKMESLEVSYAEEGWNQYGYGQQGTSSEVEGVGEGVARLAAEVIRVDCVLLTTNGRYVVTGSVYGPPQVWDIKTGELVKVMTGNDLSSTDLHLAGGDSLLVGQVANVAPMKEKTSSGLVTSRVLQIWDFSTGNPLNMPKKAPCTATCLMPDGERIVLARAEDSGTRITITVWDLPGNQLIQTLRHDVTSDVSIHVGHVIVSDDGRYVAAAYQNPSNWKAVFVVFDLLLNHQSVPKTMTFNASAEVSAILDDHEIVTGTRKGELVVWNMSSGKVLRQLLQPSSGQSSLASRRGSSALVAHQLEVKAVAVSGDHLYLVSASADHTLILWHLETERLQFTLSGHTDEVTCCSFSYDSELIASGSLDRTIRLWRSQDGLPVAVFVAGVDIFKVLVSNNKRTVVALGDQHASRKLIMLQIIRTKTKGRLESQATSPTDFNNRAM